MPPQAFPQLTAREREILDLLAQGSTNSAIAGRLVLSPKTVRNYVSAIFTKLQVADRTEVVIRARTAGLGGLPIDGPAGRAVAVAELVPLVRAGLYRRNQRVRA